MADTPLRRLRAGGGDELRTPQLHTAAHGDVQRWYTSYEQTLEDRIDKQPQRPARTAAAAAAAADDLDLASFSARLDSRNPNDLCNALVGLRERVAVATRHAELDLEASMREEPVGSDSASSSSSEHATPNDVEMHSLLFSKRSARFLLTPSPTYHMNVGDGSSEVQTLSLLVLKARMVLSDLVINVLLRTREKLYDHYIFWQWVESHSMVRRCSHPDYADTLRTLRRTLEVAAGVVHISTTSLGGIPPTDTRRTRQGVANIVSVLRALLTNLHDTCADLLAETKERNAWRRRSHNGSYAPRDITGVIDPEAVRQCFNLVRSTGCGDDKNAPAPAGNSAGTTNANSQIPTPRSAPPMHASFAFGGRACPSPAQTPSASVTDLTAHLQRTPHQDAAGTAAGAGEGVLMNASLASGPPRPVLRQRCRLPPAPLRASAMALDELREDADNDEHTLDAMLEELRSVRSLAGKLLDHAAGVYRRYMQSCATAGFCGFVCIAALCYFGYHTERMSRVAAWLRSAKELAVDFFTGHVIEPVQDIRNELLSVAVGEKAETLHREVHEGSQSLRKMLTDFLAVAAPTAESALDAARHGDINDPTAWHPVHSILEDQIRYPLFNTARGEVGRALLLQMMRSKLVIDQQSVEVNLLLRANRINMNAMGMFPAFGFVYMMWNWVRGIASRLNRRLPMNNPAVKSIFCFREIHRLFSYLETTPAPLALDSDNDRAAYVAWLEHHGKVLAALSMLERAIASMPLRIEVRAMLAEDIEELKSMYAANEVRMTNVDRIWTMFPWIIGVDASSKGKTAHQVFSSV